MSGSQRKSGSEARLTEHEAKGPCETANPAPRPRGLHGRRSGRPLNGGRRRALERLLPERSVALPPTGQALDAGELKDGRQQLWLEVGFGNGEHLLGQAERNADATIIGVEPFINGMAALLAGVEDRDLNNVRVFQDDARLLVAALPESALDRCFVLFPDPWPKARHHKRRFINADTLDQLARCLKPGAELRLATDDPGLLDWMLWHTARHPAFQWQARGPADWRQRPEDWVVTRYEEKAIAAGRVPRYLSFLRR